MKLCIVSGILEPETGGPATYAPRLASKLAAMGHDVTVVAYSSQPSYPSDAAYDFKLVRVVRGSRILNRIRFFLAALPHIRKSDAVYMLDWFAAGMPAALAARIARKPYVVRVGGDYLWEQRYLESGKTPLPLLDFYVGGFHRHYPILFFLTRSVLRGAAHVVFNSDVQRDLYEDIYGVSKTSSIYNPVPHVERTAEATGAKKEFIYWGRFIVMKNLTTLVRAFAKAHLPGYVLTLIGEGPRKREIEALIAELHISDRVRVQSAMLRDEVLERVKDSRAFVLPSWTDISPNQVYEALALELPSLVTKHNFLSIREHLPDTLDPSSVRDVAAKLEMLADDAKYKAFADAFRMIRFEHSWDDVARQHEELLKKIV